MFTLGGHTLLIQMSCCQCLSCLLTNLCLLPANTGEVHAGRAGKPWAVQKVFCSGAEAEQPKHEGVVWSVYGESCFVEEIENRGREKEKEKRKKNNDRTIFVTCGLSRLRLATVWFKKDCVGGGNKKCSQKGQLTADSVNPSTGKVCLSEVLYFNNNFALIGLRHWLS